MEKTMKTLGKIIGLVSGVALGVFIGNNVIFPILLGGTIKQVLQLLSQ